MVVLYGHKISPEIGL